MMAFSICFVALYNCSRQPARSERTILKKIAGSPVQSCPSSYSLLHDVGADTSTAWSSSARCENALAMYTSYCRAFGMSLMFCPRRRAVGVNWLHWVREARSVEEIMRNRWIFQLAPLAMLLVNSASGQPKFTVAVPATANIFAAGQSSAFSGELPPVLAFPAGSVAAITLEAVGAVTLGGGEPYSRPAGIPFHRRPLGHHRIEFGLFPDRCLPGRFGARGRGTTHPEFHRRRELPDIVPATVPDLLCRQRFYRRRPQGFCRAEGSHAAVSRDRRWMRSGRRRSRLLPGQCRRVFRASNSALGHQTTFQRLGAIDMNPVMKR